jgi:hypothetical protein
MNKIPIILITTPHSFCFYSSTENRRCDERSHQAGFILFNYLKQSGIQVMFLPSTYDRQLGGDQNRKESRQSLYRKEIDQIYKQFDVLWTIDIHSYPQIDSFKKPARFVILNIPIISVNNEIELFKPILNEEVRLLHGSTLNDIMYVSRLENKIPSILIEVYERVDDNELEEFMKKIGYILLENLYFKRKKK